MKASLGKLCVAEFMGSLVLLFLGRDPISISIYPDRRGLRKFSEALFLLPLSATKEWGEDRGEGPSNLPTLARLFSPALCSISWRRGSVWLRLGVFFGRRVISAHNRPGLGGLRKLSE